MSFLVLLCSQLSCPACERVRLVDGVQPAGRQLSFSQGSDTTQVRPLFIVSVFVFAFAFAVGHFMFSHHSDQRSLFEGVR